MRPDLFLIPRHLLPSLDSQILARSGWHLQFHTRSLQSSASFTCVFPVVVLPEEAPGGTNRGCRWLLAHGGWYQWSRRQGCCCTKRCSVPLPQAVPKEDVLACQLFLLAFVLEQWSWTPGTRARISSLAAGKARVHEDPGPTLSSQLLVPSRSQGQQV